MAVNTRYCTFEAVSDLLPKGRAGTTVTDSEIDAFILEASREMDTRLASAFIPFNSVTHAVYPTPRPIQTITARATAALCLEPMLLADRNSRYGELLSGWREYVKLRVDDLLKRTDIIPQETAVNEAMTKGTGSEYSIDTSESFMATSVLEYTSTSAGDILTVIPETIVVTAPAAYTGYRYKEHFDAYYHTGFRKWVYRDFGGSMLNGASPTITYAWSYSRYLPIQKPGNNVSGHFAY